MSSRAADDRCGQLIGALCDDFERLVIDEFADLPERLPGVVTRARVRREIGASLTRLGEALEAATTELDMLPAQIQEGKIDG